jgi:predicted DNA-binding transcriptional regulator YafY
LDVTRPTSRVLTLLELLQSGGTRTVAELADRLGVDERTVRRYIDHLLDLDVPVESVRGRYGGYRLRAGHRMPPLMLDDDEALAVLLGLIAGQRSGLLTASGTASETAAAKIRRMLPERLTRRLDALLGEVAFTGPAREAAAPDAGVLLALADAIRPPGVLATLDRPFVIEHPDELRNLVRELAERLAGSALTPPPSRPRCPPDSGC